MVPLVIVVVIYIYTTSMRVVGVPAEQRQLPPHENFPLYYPLLIIHMIGATAAMLTMCLQVWPWLRQHHPKVHRVSGRIYLLGTLVSGVLGLVIVWVAPKPGKVGALCLLIFWLATTAAAYRAVRRKDFAKHRRYMLYSFAVAANNLWAALGLMVIQKFEIPLDIAYYQEAARWVPWVGNVMLVQWWLYRTARRPSPAVPGQPG
ncbi:DUF2306 domain-containing protein [Amycolatopsis sp. BJA-103]|uniref:DUF2306 domain-containing protein n=1 Tax=Amycolatopsis sp. BJA-103 TaxID=1911175 RepID=UPI000C76C063|nr:DUF2306 domain-containing protein [Amycolatopsis sp. BJA-103]